MKVLINADASWPTVLNENQLLKHKKTHDSITVLDFHSLINANYKIALDKLNNSFFLKKEHKYRYEFKINDALLQKIIATSNQYISFVFQKNTKKISRLKTALAQMSIVIKDVLNYPTQYIVVFEKLPLSCCELDSLRDFCNNSDKISPHNYPILSDFHLKNCKVVPYRSRILNEIPKNLIGCELGVARGHFSEQILKLCSPKKLILIDLETEYIEKEFSQYSNVVIKKGDTKSVLEQFKNRYFDFIYIDANHSYKGCKRDLKLSLKKIKKDGYIILDDYLDLEGYNIEGDHLTRYKSFGVTKAVNEFCIEYDFEIVYYSFGPRYSRNVCIRKI